MKKGRLYGRSCEQALIAFPGRSPIFQYIEDALPSRQGAALERMDHREEARKNLARMRSEHKTIALLLHAAGTGKTLPAGSDAISFGKSTLLYEENPNNVFQFCYILGKALQFHIVFGIICMYNYLATSASNCQKGVDGKMLDAPVVLLVTQAGNLACGPFHSPGRRKARDRCLTLVRRRSRAVRYSGPPRRQNTPTDPPGRNSGQSPVLLSLEGNGKRRYGFHSPARRPGARMPRILDNPLETAAGGR